MRSLRVRESASPRVNTLHPSIPLSLRPSVNPTAFLLYVALLILALAPPLWCMPSGWTIQSRASHELVLTWTTPSDSPETLIVDGARVLRLPGYSRFAGEPGGPAWPEVALLLPGDCEELSALHVTYETNEIQWDRLPLGDLLGLFPKQPPEVKQGERRPVLLDRALYAKSPPPDPVVSLRNLGTWRQIPLSALVLSPVRPDGPGMLRQARSITVRLTWTGAMPRLLAIEARFLESVCDETFGTLDWPVDSFTSPTILIYRPDSWSAALKPYTRLLKEFGYQLDVRPVGELAGDAFALRETLRVRQSEGNLPWGVLLVGDQDTLPAYSISSYYHHLSDPRSTMLGDDPIPDLIVGRFPVRNAAECSLLAAKTEARLFPATTDWSHSAAFLATDDPGWAAMTRETFRALVATLQQPTGDRLTRADTLWGSDGVTPAQVQAAFGSGQSLVEYSGHGSYGQWLDPPLDLGGISSLSANGIYPLVVSNACLTGGFGQPECLGEALLHKSGGGAGTFIGATDLTYWTEDDYLQHRFYAHLRESGDFGPGALQLAALLDLYISGTSLGEYYFEVYHVLGDPFLPVPVGAQESLATRFPVEMPRMSRSYVLGPRWCGLPSPLTLPDGVEVIVRVESSAGDRLIPLGNRHGGSIVLPLPTGPEDTALTFSLHRADAWPVRSTVGLVAPTPLTLTPVRGPAGEEVTVHLSYAGRPTLPVPLLLGCVSAWDTVIADGDSAVEIAFTPECAETVFVYLFRSDGMPRGEIDFVAEAARTVPSPIVATATPLLNLLGGWVPGFPGELTVSPPTAESLLVWYMTLDSAFPRVDTVHLGGTLERTFVPTLEGTVELTCVVPGAASHRFRIPVSRPYAESAWRFVDPSGLPVPGVRVQGERLLPTGIPDGLFTQRGGIGGILPSESGDLAGSYRLTLSASGRADTTVESYRTVRPETLSLTLPPHSQAILRLTVTTGSPLTGEGRVILESLDGTIPVRLADLRGDSLLTWDDLIPGGYRVTAKAPGRRTKFDVFDLIDSVSVSLDLSGPIGPILIVDDTYQPRTDSLNSVSLVLPLLDPSTVVRLPSEVPSLDPEDYAAILWLAGTDTLPMRDSAGREWMVRAARVRPFWVESGDLGWAAYGMPIYPEIRDSLLSILDWNDDNARGYRITDHALAAPFEPGDMLPLPDSLDTQLLVGWVTEFMDVVQLGAEARLVYQSRTYPGRAGMAWYAGPDESVRGVYTAFAVTALTDTLWRDRLVGRIVNALGASGVPFPWVVSGRVRLDDGTPVAGARVRLHSARCDVELRTNASGTFAVDLPFADSLLVTAEAESCLPAWALAIPSGPPVELVLTRTTGVVQPTPITEPLIRLHPLPADREVFLSMGSGSLMAPIVMDVMGREVGRFSREGADWAMETVGLADGVYWVQAARSEGAAWQRLTVVHGAR